MNAETPEAPDMSGVQAAVNQLSEHFDTVQIFVTKHEGSAEMTFASSRQSGSAYTRYGQIREWLLQCDALTMREAKDDRL